MKSTDNPTTPSKLPCISESKYVPPEIWTYILSKLPAITLLKFRCVCKSWRSDIDNPIFAHMHSQNSGNNKLLLVMLKELGETEIGEYKKCLLIISDAQARQKNLGIFIKYDLYTFRLIGSCNGLLLMEQYAPPGYHKEFRLLNPCIHKWLTLPACPISSSLLGRSWYLFGFAPDSKDYKAVVFGLDDGQGKDYGNMYFAVYTLSNQQWTVRNNRLNVPNLNSYNRRGLFHSLSTAVLFQDTAYWLGQNDEERNGLLTHLGSFDFDTEIFTFLELPFCWGESTLRFLFLLGKSLAVFSISEATSSIWVLQQNNVRRPWTLWFSGKSSKDGYEIFSLCYKKCQKLLFCESDGGYFVCGDKTYNIASRKVHKLGSYIGFDSKVETYSESLMLFKGYGASDAMSRP